MREADRQRSRECRDRLIQTAEHITKKAHKLGGKATVVVREHETGADLDGTVEGVPLGRFLEEIHEP